MKYFLGDPNPGNPEVKTIDLYGKPDIVADLNQPLDLPENSADELHAFHVFEHLRPIGIRKVLESWVRALKPGGYLVIETPDLDRVIGWYLMTQDDLALKWMFGEQSRDGQVHYWGWNKERLYHLFEGLNCKIQFTEPRSYQAKEGPVLRLEAQKL